MRKGSLTMSEEVGLKVSVLASGSTGNATYIETPKQKLLIDAGLSGKKIEGLMNSIGRTLKDVDKLLVTHEHSDHIKGVGILARRYGLDVYANEKTWEQMAPKIGQVKTEQKHIFERETVQTFGDLDVQSFGVSHDATDPQFYKVNYAGKSFAIVTDTGYVSDRVKGIVENADGYLFECNHDTEMLRAGIYPWALKQRILSDQGHLSNEDGANALMSILGARTKQIYLGHLSQENNVKELAHLTVQRQMQAKDFGVDRDFLLLDTDPAQATELAVL